MSYILDALKRADAERVRGQVPGLHAHPLNEPGTGERGGAAPRWALWAGIGVGAVVLAALAWRMGADANAPVPAPLPPATPAPEPLAQAAPPPAVVAQTTPPAVAPAIPSYAPAPAAATRPPVKDARPAAQTLPAPATQVPPPPTVQAPPAPLPPAAPANARVPMLSELPASLRQQLPALAVSGSVYSDDAASRFIMLNGDVVKEGAQPAPGLVVERIEPKSAVLRFKGERFRLPY